MTGIKTFQQSSHAGHLRRMVIEVDCNEIPAKGLELFISNAVRAEVKKLITAVRRKKNLQIKGKQGSDDNA